MAPKTPTSDIPKKGTLNKTPTKVTPSNFPAFPKATSKVSVPDLCKTAESISFLWLALQHELEENSSIASPPAVLVYSPKRNSA